MGGTVLGCCDRCNVHIDIDPLRDDIDNFLCDDCKEERAEAQFSISSTKQDYKKKGE